MAGMQDLRHGREPGPAWRTRFIALHLGERRRGDLAESCALQSLTGEVARADAEARAEAGLQRILELAAAGMPGADAAARRAEAIALLALLAGGVSIARAVPDPALAEEIAEAVRGAALRLAAGTAGPARP